MPYKVSAGFNFTLAIGTEGQLFSFGSSRDGSLGREFEEYEGRPQHVISLASVQICHIGAGPLHALVVTTTGQLYSWMDGFHGRLGHGTDNFEAAPRHVSHIYPPPLGCT